MLQVKDCSWWIKPLAACAGIILCITITILIILFLLIGVVFLATYPLCSALYFGTEEPHIVVLPDLHNLSSPEWFSLLAGTYELTSKYNLQLTEDALHRVELCIIKRYYTKVSACVEIGTGSENMWICTPDTRPDCLPSAVVDHWFGVSRWFLDESTVYYTVVDIDSSKIYGKVVTNTTTTLSAVWYDMLGCQIYMNLTIAVIFFGSLIFICCLGCAGCCFRICCKKKW